MHTFLRVTICPLSGCIARIEEKFDVESCLGKQNSSLIQCKTASTVQCYNQGTMTKVKKSVVRHGVVTVTVTIV